MVTSASVAPTLANWLAFNFEVVSQTFGAVMPYPVCRLVQTHHEATLWLAAKRHVGDALLLSVQEFRERMKDGRMVHPIIQSIRILWCRDIPMILCFSTRVKW